MSILQLRATLSRPDVDHLVRLRASHGAYEALPLLAGHHQGLRVAAPWRREPVATQAPHIFPLPGAVPVLLDSLFHGVERMFAVARTDDDDVRVATFACFGVTAIHPFDNANGRTAFDFLQLLLMHRWTRTAPPFMFPVDVHQRVGPLLAAFDEPSVSPDPAALLALAERLATRFKTTRLEDLATSPLQRVVDAITVLRV